MPQGTASSMAADAADGEIDGPLDDGVESLQRNVVNVDDGDAVEIFEPRAKGEELHEVGHDLHVHHLAARALDEVEHLHVLVERQRHVQMVDVLLADDLRRIGERAEQRQAAIAEVIAAGAIVDEADDLIAELAVLENLLGDDAAELAGAGNQNALEADARLPAPLEHLAHELARAERERDVDDEEQAPRRCARPDRRRPPAFLGRGVVGVEVQRADDAENDRHDGADEDEEEIVDARSAAPQAVDALEVIRQRHQHGDERHHRDILRERRIAAGDRDEPARKTDRDTRGRTRRCRGRHRRRRRAPPAGVRIA